MLGGEGGLRIGEIVALEWSDIDLERRQIVRLKACETTNPELVAECRAFVQALRSEIVELKFAKSLVPHWRPSRTPYVRTRRRTSHRVRLSDVVAVSLQEIDYDTADESASERAHESARRKISDRDKFRLDDFRWSNRLPRTLKLGSRVLICTTRRNGVTEIAAPARLLEIKRYRSSRGASRAIVVVEIRKHLREKKKSVVLKALGSTAKPLRSIRGTKLLRDAALIYRLGQLWPSSDRV